MRIAVLPPRGVTFPADSPWNALIIGLCEAGHEVQGYGDPSSVVDAIVALNDQPMARSLQRRYSIPPARSVLVALEPRVTAPRMYSKSTLRRFDVKFAASPIWARALEAESFLWPQSLKPQRVPITESFCATMINADKRSAVSGSLYGLRREVVLECDQRSLPLAVFGSGWGGTPLQRARAGFRASLKAVQAGLIPDEQEAMGHLRLRPKHWKGTVGDKATAFSCAAVSLVIENSADYVSEKVVDAIRCGVAPFYVGPPLERFSIPAGVAIPCAPDAASIVSALENLTESRVGEVLAEGEDWLTSSEAEAHEITRVLGHLGSRVGRSLALS